MYNAGSNLLIITIKSMKISMYTNRSKLFIILLFYHATGKSTEISMYKAGTNLLIIFCFYHATGKSMEISMLGLRYSAKRNETKQDEKEFITHERVNVN